jgi:hypothetical protein
MPSYVFKVIGEVPTDFPGQPKLGDLIEVDMKITHYDEIKSSNPWLERYMDEAPGFVFDDKVKPPGKFMERMNYIKHHYPGAKNMFDNAKYTPPLEY